MTLLLAFRNLVHDRVRLAVTLIGILFAIVLIAVQLGLYLGACQMIASTIERARWLIGCASSKFLLPYAMIQTSPFARSIVDAIIWQAPK
jgi:hypothetical protein